MPEGSHALGGIGCHYMATWMPDRDTHVYPDGWRRCHMDRPGALHHYQHVFQNLGDGTYFHSGVLAIRVAVAAGVNVTYRILYNDAVAMTGGQPIDGTLSVMTLFINCAKRAPDRWCQTIQRLSRGNSLRFRLQPASRDDYDALQRELEATRELRSLFTSKPAPLSCGAVRKARRPRSRAG